MQPTCNKCSIKSVTVVCVYVYVCVFVSVFGCVCDECVCVCARACVCVCECSVCMRVCVFLDVCVSLCNKTPPAEHKFVLRNYQHHPTCIHFARDQESQSSADCKEQETFHFEMLPLNIKLITKLSI